jgi:hypothetical protein
MAANDLIFKPPVMLLLNDFSNFFRANLATKCRILSQALFDDRQTGGRTGHFER